MTRSHQKRVRPYERTRAFFSAFLLTLCVLLLCGGLLLADVNTRLSAFGDGVPAYVTAGDPVRTLLAATAPDRPAAALLPPAVQILRWVLGIERALFG